MPYSYKCGFMESDHLQVKGIPAQFAFLFTCKIAVTWSSPALGKKTESTVYPTFFSPRELVPIWENMSRYGATKLPTAMNLVLETCDCGVDELFADFMDKTKEETMGMFKSHIEESVKEAGRVPDEEESMVLHWLLENSAHSLWVLALVREWAVMSVDLEIDSVRKNWEPHLDHLKFRMQDDLRHIIINTAKFYWENK